MANLKVSDTTMRVSGLLMQLIESPMSFQDMFEYFDKAFDNSVYSTQVLIKYLNTLRAVGLQIQRKKGLYYLLNFLTEIKLSKQEIEAYKNLEISVLKYGTTKNIENFINLKKKFLKFFDLQTQSELNDMNVGILTSKLGLKIKFFQQLCDENQKIKIKYGDKNYTVEPKQISFIDNMVYLECYNTSQVQMTKFILEKTEFVEQQPSKSTNRNSFEPVLFELSGKLAHTYKLKEGESIIAEHDTKIFVKSYIDDYEFLARRLIRYGSLCKIINPIEFKQYFINFTDNILSLYED